MLGLALGFERLSEEIRIVAWSDRNDLLSWEVPDIAGIDVVNLHPRNAIRWLWLFENPASAHDNYAKNPAVIRALLTPKLPAVGQH